MDMKSSHDKICNEHYLVLRGDGTDIDVVRITDELYLVDGIFFVARPGSDMRKAEDLDFHIRVVKNSLFPYRGAERGYVIAFNWLTSIQKWNKVELNLGCFDEDTRRCAMEAYNEYKKRAGI